MAMGHQLSSPCSIAKGPSQIVTHGHVNSGVRAPARTSKAGTQLALIPQQLQSKCLGVFFSKTAEGDLRVKHHRKWLLKKRPKTSWLVHHSGSLGNAHGETHAFEKIWEKFDQPMGYHRICIPATKSYKVDSGQSAMLWNNPAANVYAYIYYVLYVCMYVCMYV